MDKEAARLGMPNEISAPLESANHDDLCKFGDGHSQSFEPVWEAFLALCSVALRGAGSRMQPWT